MQVKFGCNPSSRFWGGAIVGCNPYSRFWGVAITRKRYWMDGLTDGLTDRLMTDKLQMQSELNSPLCYDKCKYVHATSISSHDLWSGELNLKINCNNFLHGPMLTYDDFRFADKEFTEYIFPVLFWLFFHFLKHSYIVCSGFKL